jgi:hypothetical protein
VGPLIRKCPSKGSEAINVLGLVRTEGPELRKTLAEEAMLEGGCHKTPRSACNRIIPYYCTLCLPLINPSTNALKSDILPVAALFPG